MSDCYVLAPHRSAHTALAFLDKLVPVHEPTWDPTDPVDVLGVAPNLFLEGILEFFEQHDYRDYSMYLRNMEARPPYYAILAYCEDGSLILGLCGKEDEQAALELLGRLEEFAGSTGYWSGEEAPQSSRMEFGFRAERCNTDEGQPCTPLTPS